MAFVVPRDALKKRRQLALRIDPSVRVVRASDLAAWFTAEEAIAFAHAQAQDIATDARDAHEAERKRGYAEGLAQARLEAGRHMAEQIARTDAYLTGIESTLVELVVQATRRIVEGFADNERAAQAIRNAITLVRNQKTMTARVHPDHVAYLQLRVDQLLDGYPGIELLDIVGDTRMGRDACVLESDIGIVEASTEGQLAALESALRNVLGPPQIAEHTAQEAA